MENTKKLNDLIKKFRRDKEIIQDIKLDDNFVLEKLDDELHIAKDNIERELFVHLARGEMSIEVAEEIKDSLEW